MSAATSGISTDGPLPRISLAHPGYACCRRQSQAESSRRSCQVTKGRISNDALAPRSPLTVARLGMSWARSLYLNDEVGFSEYGFVGDDPEKVFEIMDRARDYSKILVLHHHVLPVYEREVLAKGNQISLTLDAASIMRRAQEVGVDVVLHGHQHSAKLMDFASWSAEMEGKFRSMQKKIRVVAGGSAGARSDRLPAGETNTYGLLDISTPNLDLRLRRIYPMGRLGDDW
jgi:predicted phosphodiesterase